MAEIAPTPNPTPAPTPAPRAQAATTAKPAPEGEREASLRNAAQAFEAAFLAEMLRHAGVGQAPDSFNGGAGEAAFSGTLIEAYADRIAEVGLAERIFRSLAARGGE